MRMPRLLKAVSTGALLAGTDRTLLARACKTGYRSFKPAMAEAKTIPSQAISESEVQVSELLGCSICQNVCKDPRILSCGHMVCSECITGWIKVKKGELWCPECNERRVLPQGGAESLPGGFRLNDVCSVLREKMDKAQGDSRICQRHSGMELKLICSECLLAVCDVCSKENHAGHFCESPKGLMEQVLQLKERKARNGLGRVSQLQKELAKSMEDGRDVIKDFTKRFELACTQLTRQLEDIHKEKLQTLEAQEREMSAFIDGIRSTHQALKEGESVDIHVAVDQLKSLPDDNDCIPKASSHLEVKMTAGFMDQLFSKGETKCGKVVTCGPPLPNNCGIEVVSDDLTVNNEIKIQVALKDEEGIVVTTEQSEVISVDISSVSGERIPSRVNKEEDGRFTVTFTPSCVGWLDVTIKVYHEIINRRPLHLAIKPRGREVCKIIGKPPFSQPHDILKWDSNILVVDKFVNVVNKDGKVIQTFPNKDWYFYPYSVAYHNQIFYITAMKGQAVITYNPNGNEVHRFGNNQLKKPTGIAIDGSGTIYVADGELSKILVFALNGEFRHFLGTEAKLNAPWFVKFNQKGDLVVADCGNKRIVVLDVTTGKESMSIYVKYKGQPMSCRGVDVDQHGNIYVAARMVGSGPQYECIMVYGPSGACIGSFGESPPNKGFGWVRGIHIVAEHDREVVYVVDGEHRCIRIYEL